MGLVHDLDYEIRMMIVGIQVKTRNVLVTHVQNLFPTDQGMPIENISAIQPSTSIPPSFPTSKPPPLHCGRRRTNEPAAGGPTTLLDMQAAAAAIAKKNYISAAAAVR